MAKKGDFSASFQKKADHGTAERWQHAGRVFEPSDQAGVLTARALDEDILDRLLLARVIDQRCKAAALRFRADFYDAGMSARLTGGYNPVRHSFSIYGGWGERTESEEKAYRRWRKATQAMGQMFSDSVISLVCFEEALPESQFVFVTAGLIKLAKWYAGGASDEHVNQTAAGQGTAGRRGGGVGGKLLH